MVDTETNVNAMPFKNTGRILALILVFTFCASVNAQNIPLAVGTIDSLKAAINAETNDTSRITLLLKLCSKYNRADSGVYYCSVALAQARKAANKKKIVSCLNGMGVFYTDLQKRSEALTCFKEALALAEEGKDSRGLSNIYHNMGNLFNRMDKYDLAKEYYEKGIEINIQLKDTVGTASLYANLGNLYVKKQDYKAAINNYQLALGIFKKFNQLSSAAILYGNIGAAYALLQQTDRSMYYYGLSLQEAEKYDLPEQQISMLYNMGSTEYKQQKYPEGIKYLKKGLALCKKPESLGDQILLTELLWGAYYSIQNVDSAFNYLYLHAAFKDSLSRIMNTKQLNELSVRFETDKKEKQIEIQKLSINMQEAELNKRQIILYSVSGGLILVLILGYSIYRSLQKNKRQHKIISEQKKEVDKAYTRLHEKNKEVMDSIHYAKRIQKSMLPTEFQITKELSRVRGAKKV